MAFLFPKFACANLAGSAVNLLNSGVVIYLSLSCSVFFFFNFISFYVTVSFFIQLITLGFLFSAVLRAIVAAKLEILGILSLTSFIVVSRAAVVVKLVILCISLLSLFIFELRIVLVAKIVISGISSSIFYFLQ